jgi:succinate-semialdehyde dehydrogenase/glutarate-semialdehyde dehydrogenase
MSDKEVTSVVKANFEAWQEWKQTTFALRSKLMLKAAKVLRARKSELAKLITLEMGKRITEAEAEVEPEVEVEKNNNLDSDLKKSLNDTDPWLKNKTGKE